ncbi:MAG: hypothetical protein KDJ16_15410 [Hyphomicrobiales bacterium]|nr:hypothetical protein [Hyphomicrobiales bacterium]
MAKRLTAYVVAAAVIAAMVGGVAAYVRSDVMTDPGLATKTYGPKGESFVFKAVPTGADGDLSPCVVCHSIEKGGARRVAPNLYGILGAPKARDKTFNYSKALASAGGTWTKDELDKYLLKPSAFLPGTTKLLPGIPDETERSMVLFALLKLGG